MFAERLGERPRLGGFQVAGVVGLLTSVRRLQPEAITGRGRVDGLGVSLDPGAVTLGDCIEAVQDRTGGCIHPQGQRVANRAVSTS